MTTNVRFGFRARLSIIITLVFVVTGAALLAAQFTIVRVLFESAIQATAESCTAQLPEAPARPAVPASGCAVGWGGTGGTVQDLDEVITRSVITQSVFLSDAVVTGLLWSSLALLVAFAAIGAGISTWVARRSLRRIGEVTRAAREISERDLARRLELPGPHDEIKELGDTIDGMLDRLREAFTAQDRFVANASHELRTPLTTARTALEVPLEHGDVPDHLRPALARAIAATESSERLISALLALARGRSGVRRSEPVDISALARDAIQAARPDAAARGLRLEAAIDDVPPVAGDPTLLDGMVRNLIDNALRHNVAGGSVTVRVLVHDGVVIEIDNDGEPLDPETVGELVEPFHRGGSSRLSDGGVGLGLAIVENVVATHGGTLSLRARDAGGLSVRVALPAAS